jgi:hypothetical protein
LIGFHGLCVNSRRFSRRWREQFWRVERTIGAGSQQWFFLSGFDTGFGGKMHG